MKKINLIRELVNLQEEGQREVRAAIEATKAREAETRRKRDKDAKKIKANAMRGRARGSQFIMT